jgi:nucleoside-diphosphate-sugar epimerase
VIVIIGGAGFVGSRLQKGLDPFFVLDIASQGNHYCDIGRPETLYGKISKGDCIILLAAEHKDNVSAASKYYDTNVTGTQNVLLEMDRVGCKHLVFTSSVAVYGLNKVNPDENHPVDPFNHYGKSKWEAEKVIKAWYDKDPEGKSVTIVRPTVIFGEKNRGNVYNLLRQIVSGKFLMIGKGKNRKSMAYVGNVAEFIKYRLELAEEGYNVFNYIDKPDLTMTSLLGVIEKSLNKKIPSVRIPIWLGYLGGFGFDVLAFVTRKKLTISSVRVKKFVATTQFDATKVHSSGFKAPYTLEEGLEETLNYEFVQERYEDDEVFYTE